MDGHGIPEIRRKNNFLSIFLDSFHNNCIFAFHDLTQYLTGENTTLAHIKSQVKRNRQNEKRREKNAKVKSSIRTISKRVNSTVEGKDENEMKAVLVKFVKTIDSAVKKGVVRKNTASRKKSRLAKKVNAALANQ